MRTRTDADRRHGSIGFTLIEIVIVLLLIGILAVFSSRLLTTVVQGYVLARSSDEVAQKAQMALQRMTIELSYAVPKLSTSSTTGNETTLNFITNANTSSIGNHSISLNGTNLMYSQNGTDYVLADGITTQGLHFTYYDNFTSAAANSFSNSTTTIIGISLTMRGDNWASDVSRTFSTRVTINKFP